jgi:hypothetical protein
MGQIGSVLRRVHFILPVLRIWSFVGGLAKLESDQICGGLRWGAKQEKLVHGTFPRFDTPILPGLRAANGQG